MRTIFYWKVHFLLKYPIRGISILLFTIILFYYLFFTIHSVYIAIFAVLLVFVPNINFFMPITYSVTEDGIFISNVFSVKKIDWDIIKELKVKNGAIIINPKQGHAIRKDKFFILFDVENIDDVLKFIKEKANVSV